ncbi:hypothetical protein LguiB_008210 [Lonicera macranthoides]
MNSTSSAASNSTSAEASAISKRDSDNIGWDYGTLISLANKDKVKCKLCGKEMSGGVYRIKQHIAHVKGNVSKCPKSTKEDKERCLNDLNKSKIKKTEKRKHD